jgi:hypothetical protein
MKTCLPPRFMGVGPVIFVVQKMLQRDKEKGPEAPLGRTNCSQGVVFQNMGEKGLGKVLRVMDGVPPPPNVGVKRRPVCLTQLLQSLVGTLAGAQHEAPMGRSETCHLAGGRGGTLGTAA